MFKNTIDGIVYRLKEERSLDFLSKYGKAFCVFDENDSGNLSFGFEGGDRRYFVKIAGLKTISSSVLGDAAISNLIHAVKVYEDIRHPNLIQLIEHYAHDDLYIAVFKWVDGDCLFDHWNFEKYAKDKTLVSPLDRFQKLPLEKRLISFDILLSFMKTVAECGYAAIDLYDGSLMYDFLHDRLTICDIDLFAKAPYRNTMGRMWGSSRFMSPEEYRLGACIDEITNVFNLGALSFVFFGDDRSKTLESWTAGKPLYEVARHAMNPERDKRYQSIWEFISNWNKAKSIS